MGILHELTSARLGTIINGIDIACGVTADQVIELRNLLHAHRLLVFPQQKVKDRNLVDFAIRFGPPFVAPSDSPVLGGDDGMPPEIVIIGNKATEYSKSYLGHQEVLPHSDHQWLRCPSSASLLYAVEVPSDAVSTTWINLIHAYEDLDQNVKRTIENLRLVTYNPFFRPFGSVVASYVNRSEDVPPGPVYSHPLVRTHPESGDKILYLNCSYEVEVEGMPFRDGQALISMLRQHLMNPHYQYEHRWRNGDIVFWDNQCTLHFRVAFDPSIRRVLKRVSLGGSRPF